MYWNHLSGTLICKGNAFVAHYKSRTPFLHHVIVLRSIPRSVGAVGRVVRSGEGIELISKGQHNIRCDTLVEHIGDGLCGRCPAKGTPLPQQIHCLQLQSPPPILEEGVAQAEVPYPEISLHIVVIPPGISVGETMGEAETEGRRPGGFAKESVVESLSITLTGHRIRQVVVVP